MLCLLVLLVRPPCCACWCCWCDPHAVPAGVTGSLFFKDWTSVDDDVRMANWDRRFKLLLSYPQVGGQGEGRAQLCPGGLFAGCLLPVCQVWCCVRPPARGIRGGCLQTGPPALPPCESLQTITQPLAVSGCINCKGCM
jgi:hypothetical protein